MSESGWFHCGRCGALFRQPDGGGLPEACPECGRNPVVAESEVAFVQASQAPRRLREPVADDGEGVFEEMRDGGLRKKRTRPRKKERGLLYFLLAWGVVALGLVGVVQWIRTDTAREDDEGLRAVLDTVMNERDQMLADAVPRCREVMSSFISEVSPEKRVVHVLRAAETLPKIARHQREQPIQSSQEKLELAASGILETPRGRAIETQWNIDGGKKIEVVFFEEDGTWKIDWDAFARYSSESWPDFMTGEGAPEGEFRALARRRTQDERAKIEGQEGMMAVLLAEPQAGFPNRTGAQLPEILVEESSRTGRILKAAFERKAKGEAAYGAGADAGDPSGMVRLKVRLRRDPAEDGTGWSFTIQEILAVHWLETGDLGISSD